MALLHDTYHLGSGHEMMMLSLIAEAIMITTGFSTREM